MGYIVYIDLYTLYFIPPKNYRISKMTQKKGITMSIPSSFVSVRCLKMQVFFISSLILPLEDGIENVNLYPDT